MDDDDRLHDVEYDRDGEPILPAGLSSKAAAAEARSLKRIAGCLQITADALRDARNRNRILEAENDELRALVGMDAADRLEVLRRARAANTELGAALRDLQAGR